MKLVEIHWYDSNEYITKPDSLLWIWNGWWISSCMYLNWFFVNHNFSIVSSIYFFLLLLKNLVELKVLWSKVSMSKISYSQFYLYGKPKSLNWLFKFRAIHGYIFPPTNKKLKQENMLCCYLLMHENGSFAQDWITSFVIHIFQFRQEPKLESILDMLGLSLVWPGLWTNFHMLT